MYVSEAFDLACVGESVTVVASDTDILVMLLYFWSNEMANMIMKLEYTTKGVQQIKERNFGDASKAINMYAYIITYFHFRNSNVLEIFLVPKLRNSIKIT